ncbi:MAG: sigma-70 family RNA polymerase sigma factor, partial [Bacteroidota bacterium]
ALHYAGNREEGEEIVQDAFVKFFRKLSKEVPSGNPRTYFGRIVVNAAIDLLRQRKRRPGTVAMDDVHLATAGCERNTGTDELQRQEIYRLLQMLPPSYRLAFNLFVLEGYSHPEIARKLDISEGTSKSNLAKARKHLRRLATQYYQLNSSQS